MLARRVKTQGEGGLESGLGEFPKLIPSFGEFANGFAFYPLLPVLGHFQLSL